MAKLRLAFACDEPWQAMRRVPGGRFCARCEKRVVDFTAMTEREASFVASLFAPGTLCGRLPRVRRGVPRFRAEPVARTGRIPRALPGMLVGAAFATACSATPPPMSPAPPAPIAKTSAPTGDRDGDGIADANDRCPDAPEDRDGFEDEDGCPDPDNDKDQIADAVDKCPNEPETYNGIEDEDGCPDRGGIVIMDAPVQLLQVITFAAGSDAIAAASSPVLDAIAQTFQSHPELGTFLVKGHALASEKGAAKLAERRAKRVLDALVERGVPAASLEARAVPPEIAAPGEDAAKLRRVDFEVAPKSCPPP